MKSGSQGKRFFFNTKVKPYVVKKKYTQVKQKKKKKAKTFVVLSERPVQSSTKNTVNMFV